MEKQHIDTRVSRNDTKQLVRSKLKSSGFSDHMIKSFNWFINEGILNIIKSGGTVIIENCKTDNLTRHLKFEDCIVEYPTIIEINNDINELYPNDARIRGITYASDLSLSIVETTFSPKNELLSTSNHVVQISIPMMLKSDKCNLKNLTECELIKKGESLYDCGGYFIINGKERVIVSQERLCYNQIYVFIQKFTEHCLVTAEIRSLIVSGMKPSLITASYDSHKSIIKFLLPFLQKKSISAGLIFRIYEIESKKDILDILNLDLDELENINVKMIIQNILKDYNKFPTKRDALNYVYFQEYKQQGEDYKIDELGLKFINDCFIHLDKDKKIKIMYFGYVIKRMIGVIGPKQLSEDDRDHYANKRVDVAGNLLNDLFKNLFYEFIKNIKQKLANGKFEVVILLKKLSESIISKGLKYAMSTGNWGIQKCLNTKTGVSQVLVRINYTSMISHFRRVMTPTGKEGKMTKVRQLHCTQWGIIDPAETPEGGPCGIVKNFTMMADVTIPSDPFPVMYFLHNSKEFIDIININYEDIDYKTKIFINGKWIGCCYLKNSLSLKNDIKEAKRLGILDNEISVQYDDVYEEIRIFTDGGRCTRPVLTVKDDKLLITKKDIDTLTWRQLIENGLITIVDSNDLEDSLLSLWPDEISKGSDYCEIHPSTILGVCTSLIPFPDHNQSPRNSYYASMCKQAIGIDSTNVNLRMDTMNHVLSCIQRPLVTTGLPDKLSDRDYVGFDELPAGLNVILAIMTHTGFNQEDSIIFKRGSIERGMFHSILYRTHVYAITKDIVETFEYPPKDIQNQYKDYSKLSEITGIIKIGSVVTHKTAIVGKTIVINGKKTDRSMFLKHGEEGIVDNITESRNENGFPIIKVRLRTMRIPEIGDKYVSRVAQKGTIGMILNDADMPFTAEGIIPDIILNPHAIPSRMTINKLLEMLIGKATIVKGGAGQFKDGSVFSDVDIDSIFKSLRDSGYESTGNEQMYDGCTGEPFEARIFIGPVYYHKLKHMVQDKEHARSTGMFQLMTKQPLAGRARDGGLRFGSMECDTILSYGASGLLNERIFVSSDKYEISVCDSCKNINTTSKLCFSCGNNNIKMVNMPYACKLLMHELQAMGMSIKIKPTKL